MHTEPFSLAIIWRTLVNFFFLYSDSFSINWEIKMTIRVILSIGIHRVSSTNQIDHRAAKHSNVRLNPNSNQTMIWLISFLQRKCEQNRIVTCHNLFTPCTGQTCWVITLTISMICIDSTLNLLQEIPSCLVPVYITAM